MARTEESLRQARDQVTRLSALPGEAGGDDTVEVLSKVLRQKEEALTALESRFAEVSAERNDLAEKERFLNEQADMQEKRMGLLERRERALTAYVRSEALGADRLQPPEQSP